MTRGRESRFWLDEGHQAETRQAPSLSPGPVAAAAADQELVDDLRRALLAWQNRLGSRRIATDVAGAARFAAFVIERVRESSRGGTALTFLRPARLVTLTEIASDGGVPRSTLSRWAASGEVAGRKLQLFGGRGRWSWVVDLNDVERKLREQEQ